MPLTENYRAQLKSVHAGRPINKEWGTTGGRNAGGELVRVLRGRGEILSVLDFGSGQGTLEKYVAMSSDCHRVEWQNYDPGIPGIDKLPDRKFDMIVSSDVLEHVEPDILDETLAWMREHATKGMYHQIACDPCGLILPDGRNAHLICEKLDWWLDKFVVPGWGLMYSADCHQLKRGTLRNHCNIQVDKL